MNKIILASGSPRRRELLSFITDDFIVVKSNVDEIIPNDITAENASQYLAVLKATDVASKYPENIVIGCDTTVIIDGKILGKPKDESECKCFLTMLSGRTHRVITGCAVALKGNISSFSVSTEVTFRNISAAEIDDYISTGEPFDKAGGYGIQGKGSLLIEKINGDYFNVVGLPVSRLNLEIKKYKEYNYE